MTTSAPDSVHFTPCLFTPEKYPVQQILSHFIHLDKKNADSIFNFKVLNLHGEVLESLAPEGTTLEEAFLPTLQKLHEKFPKLRIVVCFLVLLQQF